MPPEQESQQALPLAKVDGSCLLQHSGAKVLCRLLEKKTDCSREQHCHVRRSGTGAPALPSQAILEKMLQEPQEAFFSSLSPRDLLAAAPDVQHLSPWQLAFLRSSLQFDLAEDRATKERTCKHDAVQRFVAILDRFLCEAAFKVASECSLESDRKLFPLAGSRTLELGATVITTLGIMEQVVGLDAIVASDPDLSSCWQLPCESEDGPLFLQVGCIGLILGRAPINGWPLLRVEKGTDGAKIDVWHVYDDSVSVVVQKEEPQAKSPSQIRRQERHKEAQAKSANQALHQNTHKGADDLRTEAKNLQGSCCTSKRKNPQDNIRRQLRFVASPQRWAFHSKTTHSPMLRSLLETSRVPDVAATPPSPSMATMSPCTPAGQHVLTSGTPRILTEGPPKRPVRKAGLGKGWNQITGAGESRMGEPSSTPYQAGCSPPPQPKGGSQISGAGGSRIAEPSSVPYQAGCSPLPRGKQISVADRSQLEEPSSTLHQAECSSAPLPKQGSQISEPSRSQLGEPSLTLHQAVCSPRPQPKEERQISVLDGSRLGEPPSPLHQAECSPPPQPKEGRQISGDSGSSRIGKPSSTQNRAGCSPPPQPKEGSQISGAGRSRLGELCSISHRPESSPPPQPKEGRQISGARGSSRTQDSSSTQNQAGCSPPPKPKEGSQISEIGLSRVGESPSTPYQAECSPPPWPRPPEPALLPEPSRICFGAGQGDSKQGSHLVLSQQKLPEPSESCSKQLPRSQSEIIDLLPQLPRSRSEILLVPAPDSVRRARRAFAEAELALLLMDCTHRSTKPKRKPRAHFDRKDVI